MKLRKPCSHNLYDAHRLEGVEPYGEAWEGWPMCPGGVFLPDDTLVINRQALVLMGAERFHVTNEGTLPLPLFDFLDALSVREAE